MVSAGLLWILQIYRKWISPLLGNHCRFYPTCSEYAQIMIREEGVFRGIGKTIIRLLKCHPFHPGGDDIVKPRKQHKEKIKR